ncbi:MAG: hypothetical protein ACM3MI_01100 [Clostridiales bacterium]
MKNAVVYFLALVACMFSSCDKVTSPDHTITLNSKLHQLFYWGFTDMATTATRAPNIGASVGPDVLYPCWINQNQIFFYSAEEKNAVTRKGFFLLNLDPQNFSFKDYSFYPFENDGILDIKNIAGSSKFLVAARQASLQKILLIELNGNGSVSLRELIGDEWKPGSAAIFSSGEEFIFYGTNPQNNVSGFYKAVLQSTGAVSHIDLLYNITLKPNETASFAVTKDNRYLIFGQDDNTRTRVRFMQLGIDGTDTTLKVIADRGGSFNSVAADPANPSKLLLNYGFPGNAAAPPQCHIELFDLTTSRSEDLDVRTTKFTSRFIVNENPSFSPDGRHFAFTAGAFDGEGGIYPLELWIYSNVQ